MVIDASAKRSGKTSAERIPFVAGHERGLLYSAVGGKGERNPRSEHDEGLEIMPRTSARQVEAELYVEQDDVDVAPTEDAVILGPAIAMSPNNGWTSCS